MEPAEWSCWEASDMDGQTKAWLKKAAECRHAGAVWIDSPETSPEGSGGGGDPSIMVR